MAHYIIQVVAFQLVFLLIYDAFLKRETFFNWNRVYLITSALASVIIPFIKIDSFKETLPQEFIINLPEVVIGNVKQNNPSNLQLDALITESAALFNWEIILYMGVLLAFIGFVFKVSKIVWLLARNPKSKLGQLSIVKLQNSNVAFSFLHFIFLGERLNDHEKASILKHEIIHVKEKHTLDLLFFEVLRILFWFNPLVYMYQNRIMLLHEFIADAKMVVNEDKASYYQNLLSQVFETKNISFINPFFKQSLIKKRIVMLQKSKSKQINLLKYALLIPLVVAMLIYSACTVQNEMGILSKDLSEYTYTVNIVEVNSDKLALEEANESKQKQENFLKSNPNYVIWADFNSENQELVYSLHNESEQIPEGYGLLEIYSKEGNLYRLYSPSKFSDKSEKKYLNDVEVPFGVVEHVPIFPDCETLETNEERKACMSKSIADHVNKNFNTKIAEENNLVGRQRINVIFKIDKEGNITEVRSRAPHPALEAEAIRVIKTLPKMIPGEQKGKKVTVPYSLPIVFQVQDDKSQDKKE
ncbi:M56 family metallopeptidase [Mariniflexile gromovii]|uniref:Energy transducer TonB n=1 Tax=Mariniflexile gromovii TaxID=362523 RepID=A0ABS4BYK6_9FLAO|nr:M56 family metallopeptidase [Mariniflexile gromovii]MBP0905669.1 energy transducer TonB [Mariniflexile gromovii]